MTLFIASDHKGVELKDYLYETLKELGYHIEKSKLENNEEDDYPDFAFDVCKEVVKDKENFGILICGNGIGISIAANKVKGIRCARVVNKEDAYHAKCHNNANVIAFGGIPKGDALEIIETFLKTQPPTEERHLRRVQKITQYEDEHGL